jgi:hypothetical protein
MRMVLARQERMWPQGMGWALLFMQTSTAVRRLLPQLRARLAAGKDRLAAWNWVRSCFGVREISWFSRESAGGIVTLWKALRARVKKASGERPEQVPWVCHSWRRRPGSG